MSRQSGTILDLKGTLKTNESIDSLLKNKDADLGNDQYMKLSKSYQNPKDGIVNTLSSLVDVSKGERKSVVNKEGLDKLLIKVEGSSDSKKEVTI